ncbi:hypothetical protein, partial [Bradyrhizobium elkanii]
MYLTDVLERIVSGRTKS